MDTSRRINLILYCWYSETINSFMGGTACIGCAYEPILVSSGGHLRATVLGTYGARQTANIIILYTGTAA